MTESVKVYVRKSGYTDRSMSFIIPAGISQTEALNAGWAIDGNSLARTVKLTVLAKQQQELIAWLSSHELEVEFA